MQDIDFTQLKALIVEDNDFVRFMVKKHMTGFGFKNVYEATDGFEGLKVLNDDNPDIVVCDINMEPVNGFDFLKHVRGLESPLKSLPIIFLTSSADEGNVKKAVAGGVDAYMLKPVMPDELKQKIELLIQKKHSA